MDVGRVSGWRERDGKGRDGRGDGLLLVHLLAVKVAELLPRDVAIRVGVELRLRLLHQHAELREHRLDVVRVCTPSGRQHTLCQGDLPRTPLGPLLRTGTHTPV